MDIPLSRLTLALSDSHVGCVVTGRIPQPQKSRVPVFQTTRFLIKKATWYSGVMEQVGCVVPIGLWFGLVCLARDDRFVRKPCKIAYFAKNGVFR